MLLKVDCNYITVEKVRLRFNENLNAYIIVGEGLNLLWFYIHYYIIMPDEVLFILVKRFFCE